MEKINEQLKRFGENLEYLIKKKFRSLEKFSKVSNIPIATLYRYIRGETAPDLTKLIQMKQKLKTPFMGLLYVIEDYDDETVGIMEEIKYIKDNFYARMDLDKYIEYLKWAISKGYYRGDYE